jgi:hypothetical protein
MNDKQLDAAAKHLHMEGSFASAIADAYFVADGTNRRILTDAFGFLFERAYTKWVQEGETT